MITLSGYRKMPVIVREFGYIVDMLKSFGTITESSENNGIYTLISVNHGLVSYEVIKIDDIDYVVSIIDADTFSIESETTGLDFTDFVWYAKAPYYEFGHPLEIVNTLSKKDRAEVYSYQKYPLIALFQDFPEEVTAVGVEVSLSLLIINITKPGYVASDRYTYNFEPVLYPIVQQLERALQLAKNVEVLSPDFGKKDLVYLGKEGTYTSEGNTFNDHLDAIEISNLKLRFKTNC